MGEALDRCWTRIGVRGDATCARLATVGHCRNCDEYTRAGRELLDREAPGALRAEWTRLLAEPRSAVAAGGKSLLVFEVHGEYLALPTILVQRVTEARQVHVVPARSSAVFTGLVNMDGELLPCISVAAALQVGESKTADTPARMLLLDDGGGRLVCIVDRVIGLIRVSPDSLESPPVTLARKMRALTMAVFSIKERRAGLLDGDKFMQRLKNSTAPSADAAARPRL